MKERNYNGDWMRRDLMRWGAGIGAGALASTTALAASTGRTAAAQVPPAPRDMTPDMALDALARGNQRFVEGKTTSPNRNMARLKETAPKQSPFAAFLGCADSRVPIEIVFDQGFGDIFVTRVAGNVADPTVIGSLEFGCLVLGAKVLYVLGHASCGAVAATLRGDAVPGQISTLYQHIRPAAKASGGDVNKAIRLNVQHQAEVLSEASPVLAGLIKERKLKVAGGVYDLQTGRVTPVAL